MRAAAGSDSLVLNSHREQMLLRQARALLTRSSRRTWDAEIPELAKAGAAAMGTRAGGPRTSSPPAVAEGSMPILGRQFQEFSKSPPNLGFRDADSPPGRAGPGRGVARAALPQEAIGWAPPLLVRTL